jgi:hypothetical protein
MPVRLGISPIGWSNDDLPELGGDTPLDSCLAEARAAGYEGVELGHKFPRDPAILRHILERFGLALISGWYSGRLLERSVRAEIAAIEPHCSLLVAMGCAVLVYAETSGSIAGDRHHPLSGRPRLGASDWHDFGVRLTELADHLSACGIALVYHHHMGTVIESEAEIDRLMAVTGDKVGLLLDNRTCGLCRRRSSLAHSAARRSYQACPLQGCPARGTGSRPRRRRQLSRRRSRRCVYRAGRRLRRFFRRARGTCGSGLQRLAGCRGRTGSRKSSAARLCSDWSCPAACRRGARGPHEGRAMKIGMITDSLGAPSLGKLLGTAAELGIYRLEFAAGNWSQRALPDVRPDG